VLLPIGTAISKVSASNFKNEVAGACGTYGEEMKCIEDFGWVTRVKKNTLEVLGVNG
jgi:hypothetical protein